MARDGDAPPRRERPPPKKKKKLVSTKNQLRSVERLLSKVRCFRHPVQRPQPRAWNALGCGGMRLDVARAACWACAEAAACAGERREDARCAGAAAFGAAEGAGGHRARRAGAQAGGALPQGQVLRRVPAALRQQRRLLPPSAVACAEARTPSGPPAERKKIMKAQVKLRAEIEAQGWVRAGGRSSAWRSPAAAAELLGACAGQRRAARAAEAAGRGRGVRAGPAHAPPAPRPEHSR